MKSSRRPPLTRKRLAGVRVLVRHLEPARADGRIRDGLFRYGRDREECRAARAAIDWLHQLVAWNDAHRGGGAP